MDKDSINCATTDKQHPQRCETCSHKQFHAMGLERCEITGELVQKQDIQYKIISQVGCASHSAAPTASDFKTCNSLRLHCICGAECQFEQDAPKGENGLICGYPYSLKRHHIKLPVSAPPVT